MNKLSAIPLNDSLRNDGKVKLVNINYDLDKLEISVDINETQNKKILFKEVCGFRVLDEGDLHFWWKEINLENGWCFEISKGGWFELEKQRKDFFSGSAEFYREFLVIGIDLCVSVISKSSPTIHEI